jgi:beta-phosphoglucomutase family hydrolase
LKPFAVLFDWDGVIIDSSSQHERAWEFLAAERHFVLPSDHFRRGFGKRNETIIPELGWASEPAAVRELGNRKEELYRQLVREEGAAPLPGVLPLLSTLREEGIPRAVGSSTPRENIETLMEAAGLHGLFDWVVCGDDVSRGKPDPEVFLRGAKGLGFPPAHCVVIEDALVGLEAARNAGMACVGVATTHSLEELLPHCDLAFRTLEELTPQVLGELVASRAK